MQKNQLLKSDDNGIVRIIAVNGDEVLYISCNKEKKGMPQWTSVSMFSGYLTCPEEELQQLWGIELADEDKLEVRDRNIARYRYAVIAPVLTFLEDERLRTEAVTRAAEQKHITKQTVRNYLQRYLIFNNVSALVPKKRTIKEKPPSDDEKNIRWAVNKYYYSRKKNSLNFAYKMMLAKKYTDDEGRLLQKYPSFNQFRYWYSKNKKLLTYYISRNGMSDFMRNDRVLLGGSAQVFAPAPGTAMADSTVLDLYVVSDDRTQVIGRPVLSAIVDAYSYLCLGYSLSWEAGEFSLRDLMCNVISDKKEHCKKFGIMISEEEWPNNKLPGIIITDRGAGYAGYTYSQLAELSVHIQNLEGYRGDMKGQVEKFFDLVQNYFKPHLKGAGVVAPEYSQRGSYFGDYKESSCLTLKETETILLRCIIHYNTKHLIEHFPYTQEMIGMGVKPYANDIWKYGVENLRGCNLIDGISQEELVLPAYDASARDMDAGSRLLRLSDIYQIFVPTSMTVEIYHKLYMMTAASMSKKGTADAVRQLNANYQGNAGVITGMTSSTVIAPSGMGKSSSIHKAVSLFGDLIEVDSPYQKICPVVCVTTPFDANYKGLLIQIAKELDRHLDSDFYVKSQKSTMNAQQMLAMICQVCTLHVGLLIVDEIQFLAEQKNAGPQMLRMLLQLVNSSGINMLMVGTNECIPFFQKVPQTARRTAGLQYSAMEYGSDFTELCRVLFSYQYVKEYTELSDVILQWVFEHSAGIPASLAALLHDAQEIAIMENIEALDLKTLDMAYNRRMQMLHPHILPSITKVSRNRHKKEKELQIDETENVKTDDWVSIAGIIQDSKKYGNDIVTEIMKHLPVVEVVEN